MCRSIDSYVLEVRLVAFFIKQKWHNMQTKMCVCIKTKIPFIIDRYEINFVGLVKLSKWKNA